MRGSSFGYLIKEGAKSVYANRLMSFASIGTLVACMLLIGRDVYKRQVREHVLCKQVPEGIGLHENWRYWYHLGWIICDCGGGFALNSRGKRIFAWAMAILMAAMLVAPTISVLVRADDGEEYDSCLLYTSRCV